MRNAIDCKEFTSQMVTPRLQAGELHMEFFDSFPFQRDRIGFENFPPKASAILKLRRLGFGKSYAIALRLQGPNMVETSSTEHEHGF
jgi:hypothetical protein